MKTARFTRGTGCYKCYACGKNTRQVTQESASAGICHFCYEKQTFDNGFSDNTSSVNYQKWADRLELCTTVEQMETLYAEFTLSEDFYK